MPPKKRTPRPLPTKKEILDKDPDFPRTAWGKRVLEAMQDAPGAPVATAAFPRPMGVPCVDLNPTGSLAPTATAYFAPTWPDFPAEAPRTQLVIPWRKWWTELRFQSARGVLWVARKLRKLAWKVAP